MNVFNGMTTVKRGRGGGGVRGEFTRTDSWCDDVVFCLTASLELYNQEHLQGKH